MSAKLLRGPADPDIFRTKVYGARWYRDPLPADAKWPAMTDPVPAVSTIKKAWSKPFKKKTPSGAVVPLDAYRAAMYVQENMAQLAAMHPDEVFAEVCAAPERDLAKAGDRGTGVHSVIEALALGQRLAPELHDDAVRPYVPACEKFVDEWRPVWRMTEFVVINRGLGFAGTADALVELPGTCPQCGEPFGLTVVDWKSRGSKHGAYEEEICQLGGYASGEYVVITNEAGHLERIDPPEIEHGAIVSITADDGYRLYPVEISEARHAFLGLFETWRLRRDGERVARKAVGLPVPPPGPQLDANKGAHSKDKGGNEADAVGTAQHEELRSAQGGNAPTVAGLHGGPTGAVAGLSESPNQPNGGVAGRVDESDHEHQVSPRPAHAGEQAHRSAGSDHQCSDQLPAAEQPTVQSGPEILTGDTTQGSAEGFTLAQLRSRVVDIVAAGRPLPVPWPEGTPTFKSGEVTNAHADAISEWCWATERLLELPFPQMPVSEPENAPEPEPAPTEPRPDPRADAEEWAARGRALLELLDDEPLARACAATANCDAVRMNRERFLVLQAVVTQVSEPAGVLMAHWSGSGVEIKPSKDMEKHLLAAMPTEGSITKRTKLDALQRGKRIAKRLGVVPPKSYDDLCANPMLAACVAAGHGVNPEETDK